MALFQNKLTDATFKRLAKVKSTRRPPAQKLGPEMLAFFKHSVQPRQAKFGKIGECWSTLVPEALNDHCALDSFHRGTLTVLVDTSSHLYELKQLLLAGLQQQLLLACKSAGLRKVTLKPGRWYEASDNAPRPTFDR